MKIILRHVGTMDYHRQITWPEGWPIPREGDSVRIPGLPEVTAVRLVEWLPEGDPDEDEPGEPYVYIVVGPRRPS